MDKYRAGASAIYADMHCNTSTHERQAEQAKRCSSGAATQISIAAEREGKVGREEREYTNVTSCLSSSCRV